MKRLTPALLTLLLFVVVGGLIAAYVVKTLFAGEDVQASVATRNLPVLVSDLPPGTQVTDAHLGIGTFRSDQLQPGMLINQNSIVGRVTKNAIQAASPIMSDDLYQPGQFPPLKVSAGMRAVALSLTDATQIVDGLVTPGEHVDVHLTVKSNDADADSDLLRGGLTQTLFRGVKVLSVNKRYQSAGVDPVTNSVTLELTPAQANIMILARDRGDVTLVNTPDGRGHGVVDVADENRATMEEILNLRPRPTPPAPFETETFNGSSRGRNQFRNGRRFDVSTAPSRRSQPVEQDRTAQLPLTF